MSIARRRLDPLQGSMVRPGEPWGEICPDPPALSLTGTDHALADAISGRADHPLVAWVPTDGTDLGRSVGRAAGRPATSGVAAPMDVLVGAGWLAVNSIVVGTPPGEVTWWSRAMATQVRVDGRLVWSAPATTVAITNGEFVGGIAVTPKAHPGDGVLDLLILGLRRGERREFRQRLSRGDHLPHPRIRAGRGKTVQITSAHTRPTTVDGVAGPPVADLEIHIESDRYRLFL